MFGNLSRGKYIRRTLPFWAGKACDIDSNDDELVILQGVQFGAPEPSPARTPIEELAGNAQRILDIFAANGYAIKVLLVV